MGLEDRIDPDKESFFHNAIRRTRDYIGNGPSRDNMVLGLRKDLGSYFENLSEKEKQIRVSKLEEYVDSSIQKYDTELHGIRKVVTKPAMAAAFANDIYSLVSKAPFSNFSAASYILFGAKTLAEIPAVYRYMKKSGDWYGSLKWALMKPIDYLIPVIGPAIENGLFERIVKKRVMYEAKNRFLKNVGAVSETDRVKYGFRQKLGDVLSKKPISMPEPAYA
ncbi:hypothetical protein COU57_06375 [Candidatus Pacearchaeota archaeon CG10_big_fil_rev_8_21_14_0_10_32_14]|nr:MAG: hypothetical protein COU57_06375 [Candidatus Pacearchaeota archaeon CG10_big_fil_rev_8_21_14_0_10_32_14]